MIDLLLQKSGIFINAIFVIHFFTCAFMTGVIWIIQILNYPSYIYVDKEKASEFHDYHTKNITYIVGPVMFIELLSGSLLLWYNAGNLLYVLNFLGLIAIWLHTAFISIPLHNSLSKQFTPSKIKLLVRANWVRTLLWSVRSGTLFFVVLKI